MNGKGKYKNKDKSSPIMSEDSTLDPSLTSNENISFPLIFIPIASVTALPEQHLSALIFELKHKGSTSWPPASSSIRIESHSQEEQVVSNGSLLGTDSSTQREIHSGIFIKQEPMDSDEDTASSGLSTNRDCEQSAPIKLNLKKRFRDSNAIDKQLAPQNSCSSSFSKGFKELYLPLVFESLEYCDISKYKSFPYMYVLKQGTTESYVSQDSLPRITSVNVNSSSQAILNVLNSDAEGMNGFSQTEVSFNVKVSFQAVHTLETLDENEALSDTCVDIKPPVLPVILNVTSGANTDGNSSPKETTPSLDDGRNTPGVSKRNKAFKRRTKSLKHLQKVVKDPDYQFLISLLPELKKFPQELKVEVKKKIKQFVTTTQICASRIKFEGRGSNKYHDCGVLPALGYWKL